jgi:vancomycin resistance protein YoaR
MTSRTIARTPLTFNISTLVQALIALAGGVALFFALLVFGGMSYDLLHAGRIYTGVSVAGVDVSGLRPDEAAARIGQRITFPQTGHIVFQFEKQVWGASPGELGLYLDPISSAQAAMRLGRTGGPLRRVGEQFQAWYGGVDLPPVLIHDQRQAARYLEGIAAQLDRPTVEASLQINGTDVVVSPGQVGRSVDIQATMAPLEAQLTSLSDGILPVVLHDAPPVILDASAQAEVARRILSQPLTLHIPNGQEGDPGPWVFDGKALAGLLTIQRVEEQGKAHYQVELDPAGLRTFLEGLAPNLARQPQNARFIFNDDTKELEKIQSAVIGRQLNVDASIQQINEKAAQGEHHIDLSFDYTDPAITDQANAKDLGITELVSSQTTYFYGSSAERIQNIKTAASRFHGVLVAPGETFSMAAVMGDVSLDNGYAEALIIYGDRTIKGVGGGVCQVSTTLFRTVFFGGYPVVERYSHAYRVGYYELNAQGNVNPKMAGLDATVFVPMVDFKFTNDTPYWLLMETYVSAKARTITWKFYSTSDGRKVTWDTTGLQNIVPAPDPLYQENPDLAEGEQRQVDYAADGADVTVTRTVTRDGQVYFKDSFSTHYLPWRAVIEYGPGTKIPKSKRGD